LELVPIGWLIAVELLLTVVPARTVVISEITVDDEEIGAFSLPIAWFCEAPLAPEPPLEAAGPDEVPPKPAFIVVLEFILGFNPERPTRAPMTTMITITIKIVREEGRCTNLRFK
jgi:hypothetical protein